MAVYTYFGSMSAIVREIVHDGFARLKRLFDLVEATDDPVADMALLGRVYRHNAITNRHVFEVRSEEHTSELQSLYTISYAVFCLDRKSVV